MDFAPMILQNQASLDKATYFKKAAAEERRKQSQGRTFVKLNQYTGTPGPNQYQDVTYPMPEFAGGCTVLGFPTGNSWEFWYQTWGETEYDRSAPLAGFHLLYRRRTLGYTNKPGSNAPMKMLDWDRIWP
jgi:hypothetical protein